MKRRPLVIGNWKMNLDFVEALHLTQQLGVLLRNKPLEHVEIVLCPPYCDLRSVSSLVEADRIAVALGAQHVSAFESGAHTGETSTAMLRRLGVSWVLVGHSERRQHYAMSDEVVTATLRAVVRAGQHAVLCVGEELATREAGNENEFVSAQLASALHGLEAPYHELVTVAYEPLWAIGTGVTAASEDVRAMSTHLRKELATLLSVEAAVLYGGSVTAENAGSLATEGDVDGFLVGGASLKAESFLAILQASDDCYARKR